MNGPIIRKTAREAFPLLITLTLAVILFELLLTRAMGELSEGAANMWLQKPIFQRFIKAMLGAELIGHVTITGLMTVGFAHPVLYTLLWAFLLATCSRLIAGEVEGGTADLLLALPISRASLYASTSVVWILSGLPLCLATIVGMRIGVWLFPFKEPLDFGRLSMLTVNLFALHLAVGGATICVSSMVSRRSLAVAAILAWLLASFFLNFLSQLWPAVEKVSCLGLLNYYRPLPIVRTGVWPARDLGVILGISGVAWLAGLWRFRRRDIPAT
ncbi:MAG TPA: ABC transporter permease subunit [Phycisphaerae bacterium]|nr:ABC transporter permease subunit [Phycisphaerae bacterium]